jgi:uncharacterized protein (UPF0333 family)
MKPKLVYNDKEIGEFIYEKAAMALKPKIFYYSKKYERVIDIINENVITEGSVMILESDKSLVVFAFEVTKQNGEKEYVEIKGNGEESLNEARKKGIVSCTSSNKKVYLYKEKKPKIYNAVKIVVGMTAGGFTSWTNDFYTGITTCVLVDVLESLGYSVAVECALGGGRCSGCVDTYNSGLLFNGRIQQGRRFFTFTAKSFDEQLDLDGLLYTLCDPSFHNIKFVSLFNYFLTEYGDDVDDNPNHTPSSTWHGIEKEDMTNPIGMYEKRRDFLKGNKDLFTFYVHQVKDEQDVMASIVDVILTCENTNRTALEKFRNYDFSK